VTSTIRHTSPTSPSDPSSSNDATPNPLFRSPAQASPDSERFADRHIGPTERARQRMLDSLGYLSLADLVDAVVPSSIRSHAALDLPPAASEAQVLAELRAIAGANRPMVQMIGLGFSDTVTPGVIRRNVLEDPGWYTAYTPYQPEISQGRLEALLNFQTAVSDLTGLAVSNASLLDESTAVAEAVALMQRVAKGASTIVVDAQCLPQTIDVVRTRAEAVGSTVLVVDLDAHSPGGAVLPEGPLAGVVVQYPGASGALRDATFYRAIADAAHAAGALVTMAADLLALTLIASPGDLGADVAAGTSQRFGVPLFFGGPHAGYLAVRTGLERQLPGRLVGVSVDADGAPAHRLALQTREQHIRREKATSNVCTAQALLAVTASMYAVYHGPEGLRAIASRVHHHASSLAAGLRAGGVRVVHTSFFDTVLAAVPGRAREILANAAQQGVNLGLVDEDTLRIACDEVTTAAHIAAVLVAFGVDEAPDTRLDALPADLHRTSEYLTHPVFHSHRSETQMLRYLRSLKDKDYALDRGMIPLGSCTMKLNATTEMEPISWPEFAGIHPFAPADQTLGYRQLIEDLESWLATITGYAAVSVQPNAGSQGELAGLLAIRDYHRARGDVDRNVCLIPSSAHGTNAASAVMAGLRVAVVACDDAGNVDLDDLQRVIAKHGEAVAAIMITYPSTHGVYEGSVRDICAAVHAAGGQVYVDGANLNALVGLAQPGEFGGDVSHLNLHKTFCIPHGGGGPGVGPVAVREHLAPYLPGHSNAAQPLGSPESTRIGSAVSSAPYGSAGILPISWAYIRLMGGAGLMEATSVAVLSANYVAARLTETFPVLYTGQNGLVAHECILDLRPITKATGVTVDDVAKRLMDYGFHAPTVSFPVAGTLMVEPTESEDLGELDRFCEAMIAIRAEIDMVADGTWPVDDNPLRNAPHTASCLLVDDWSHPYSRSIAAYPSGKTDGKYWPPVRRIDQAAGDRNLICSCPPLSAYED
jgi:glycine dehydrogenase